MEDSRGKKRIPLEELKAGMYVVELDRPWVKTPFLTHRRHIEDVHDIELLARHGIREVVIDTERSADAETTKSPVPSAGSAEKPPIKPPSSIAKPVGDQHESVLLPLVREISVASGIHEEALQAAQCIFEGVGRGSPLNCPVAKQTVTDLLASVTRSPEANILLTQMRRFQSDLFTHAVNVCVLSLVVGALDKSTEEVFELGLGALLHDIGQLRLPRNVLRKKGSFTAQERRLMQQHPVLGASILEREENVPPAAGRIVLEHHERRNGKGYPRGIGGDDISPLSRIVSITDAYDAMVTGRNGIVRRPIDVLRELYIEANAGAFDSELIEKVIRSLGVYPVGSLVELNTGERGIVLAANRTDAVRPTLRLVLTRDGIPLPRGPVLSLVEEESVAMGRQIVRTLDPGKERIDIMRHLNLAIGLAR